MSTATEALDVKTLVQEPARAPLWRRGSVWAALLLLAAAVGGWPWSTSCSTAAAWTRCCTAFWSGRHDRAKRASWAPLFRRFPGSTVMTVVVVTGGASGIGLAMCRAFAAAGARGVVVADLDAAACDRVAAELGAAGLACATDVAKADQVQRLVDAATARFGQVDVFCSNAGIAFRGSAGA